VAKAFERSTHVGLYAAICAAILAVAIGDYYAETGIAVWIFYLVPIGLCLFVRRPIVPIYAAMLCTVAIGLDLFVAQYLNEPSVLPIWVAQLNRSFGVIVIWLFAWQCKEVIAGRIALHHRDWLRNGQTKLSELVAGEQSIQQLSNRIVAFMATYLNAQVGAVYALDNGVLERTGGYAYSGLAINVRDRFRIGEGLVGEAAVTRMPMHLRDVPTDYLNVTSGLGERKPAELFIMPVGTDLSIEGVLELGFFHTPESRTLELLDVLAEPIGIALRTAVLQRQRMTLLEETQRQGEELQSQQEELRVANEELHEQSHALKESQVRLESQQVELEEINAQLEEQTQALTQHNEDLDRTRRQLEAKAAELERSNQYKSEFLANMSHELRTPLNSSLILAKLLADNAQGNLSAEQVQFATTIYSAGNDLLDLINDILDLSKIEARKVEVQREAVSVQALVENLTQSFAPLAKEKRLELRMDIDDGVATVFESDPQRLRQILKNLLSNALKFTEKGAVRLQIRPGEADMLAFAVSDTGIGIARQQQQIIFEPFQQADGSTSRKYGGTGLGLSISRELALLLGGRIELESAEGQGSTFTLLLPRVPPAQTQKPSAAEPRELPSLAPARPSRAETQPPVGALEDDRHAIAQGDRCLLAVEDDHRFAGILYKLAHSLGYRCLLATTADEGVDLALRYRPTAIVLDLKLPDHSGLTVLDRLKHNSATRHIPVQIVSATSDAHTALSMGAAGFTIKPVDRDQLVVALGKLTEMVERRPRTVLIVEDDPVQRDSVCKLLQSDAVQTIAVDTAQSALAKLKEASFDCMVLDLSLPDASGYELLETMASEETYSFPPVIVYTGRSLSMADEQQLRKYSDSIIIKGAKSPERLLDEVTLFLHQVESSLPPERQRMLRDARSRGTVFEGRRLLLVEDDVRNIFALSSVLEPLGAKVLIARNGREALEQLERNKDVEIVLMDIMMPEMDGLTAMKEIRKQERLARLPIIALTAKAMPDDQQRCLDAGANDYVTKPVDIEKLMSLIRIWLPK
jgi:signal transduction histidine kinase/CheY-like chemotaxis protein